MELYRLGGAHRGLPVPGSRPCRSPHLTAATSPSAAPAPAPFWRARIVPRSSTPGVSTSTLTGTVTGIAGETLTGTGTLTGTSSFGQTLSYTGTVTIDPSGVMTFTYGGANGTATYTSQARLVSATGTNTFTPGTYFTQTINGAMSNTSSSPYYTQSTATVWGGAAHDQRAPGPVLCRSYNGQTPNLRLGLLVPGPAIRLDFGGTMAGVLNPTTLQGAATIIPTPFDGDQPFVSVLPTPPSPYLFGHGANDTLPIVTTVGVNSTTGVVSGTAYATDYQDGKYASGFYTLTQTPQATPVTPGHRQL